MRWLSANCRASEQGCTRTTLHLHPQHDMHAGPAMVPFMWQVEALQLWSIFAQHNIPIHLSLDDVYPALCHLFVVPEPADAAGGRASGRAAELAAELAAGALETAAALASHSVRSGMTFPACLDILHGQKGLQVFFLVVILRLHSACDTGSNKSLHVCNPWSTATLQYKAWSDTQLLHDSSDDTCRGSAWCLQQSS